MDEEKAEIKSLRRSCLILGVLLGVIVVALVIVWVRLFEIYGMIDDILRITDGILGIDSASSASALCIYGIIA
ncbi:hypothetical protein [Ruthenibacterium lactatiformans]|uniref:hypothetical protein n=1 Tax=Ruthenibacterium lactatiformans TaxID=1550024 RepID=UPI0026710102|nr:hypothetical protein [Ruthenibacterium lactatiformans]